MTVPVIVLPAVRGGGVVDGSEETAGALVTDPACCICGVALRGTKTVALGTCPAAPCCTCTAIVPCGAGAFSVSVTGPAAVCSTASTVLAAVVVWLVTVPVKSTAWEGAACSAACVEAGSASADPIAAISIFSSWLSRLARRASVEIGNVTGV